MKGKIIVIEGTDCSGKETQAKLLVKALEQKNIKAIYMSFPDYNAPTGKIIGGPYLGKEEITPGWFPEKAWNVDPKVASLYYAADRVYHLPKIKEYLQKGYWIILDRYVESNMAFQGGKIQDPIQRQEMYRWVDTLEYSFLELPRPDMTIFLYMPYKYACILKQQRSSIDEHEQSATILQAAEEVYLELAEKYHYELIECIQNDKIRSIEDINEEIVTKVLRRMKK